MEHSVERMASGASEKDMFLYLNRVIYIVARKGTNPLA